MLAHAQELVYTLKELMPTQYQKENIEAKLGLFLEAQGHPFPQNSKTKSASALSRFLNLNPWSTRKMIREVRNQVRTYATGIFFGVRCVIWENM